MPSNPSAHTARLTKNASAEPKITYLDAPLWSIPKNGASLTIRVIPGLRS